MKLTTEQKDYFLAYVKNHKHELAPATMRMGYEGPDMPDPLESERNIRREGNHIYFYDYVDVESQLILEKMLKRCSLELLSDHVGEIMNGELSETVVIHLHSPGGLGHSGFALYDFIKSSKLPITCVVSGLCASAATLIMLACENRVMSPSSTFLMHQCSWGGYGENRYMQDLAYNAKRSMQVLINIYMKETHIAEKDENGNPLTKEQRAKKIEFTRDECVEYGIIRKPKQDVELSDERVEILNSFMDKLLQEQAEENAAMDAVGEVCCKCAEEMGEVELTPESLNKLQSVAAALIEEQKKAKEKEEQKKAREKAKVEKEKTVAKKSTTKKAETKTAEKPVKKETKPKTTKK